MKRMLFFALVLFGSVSTADAGDPDPINSMVLPWDNYGPYGQAFVCPGAGSDSLFVWVLDDLGFPCPGVRVQIDLSACTSLCVDCPNGLTAYTDASGMAVLDPHVGGCEECTVRVVAGSVEIRTYSRITSADWNDLEGANGIVDLTDFNFFASHVPPGPYDICADYNGDGEIDTSDVVLIGTSLQARNTHLCETGQPCELTPPCLDFGTVAVSDSFDTMFTITNNGGSPLSGFITETCDHYSIEFGTDFYYINPGESWPVWVRFKPGSIGTDTCLLDLGDVTCSNLFCTGFGDGPPECWVEPDSLDFGLVAVGVTKAMTFTITNTGGGLLSDSLIVYDPFFHYSIEPPGDERFYIPGEDSLVVTVNFEPADAGAWDCIIDASDGLCNFVSCTGIGYSVGDPDSGQSTVEPWDSYSYPHAFVCPGTGGADTVTVTVRDDVGVPCPYTFVEIDLSDCGGLCIDSPDGLSGTTDENGVIRLDPRVGGCEYCAVIVRANGIDIRTYPLINSADWDGGWADGIVNGADSLYLDSQSGTSDPCADYDGNGSVGLGDLVIFGECSGLSNTVTCPYSCNVVPVAIIQDTVVVGSWKDTTFTIRNTGVKTLVGTVSEDCPCDSILSGGGPYSIPGGDSLVVALRFEPNDVGDFFCGVETGDPICANFLWWGVGVEPPPACAVAPDSLVFGTVTVGSWKDTTFTIKNTGGGTLTGIVSETCPCDSILSGGGPYSIPGGDSLVVTVRFEPADTGTYDCTIETGDSLCTDVWCTGVGAEPLPACLVVPDSLDFGGVFVGSSKDTTFTIYNTGGGTLTGTVSETCPSDSILFGGGPYSIPGGDSLVVTVRFEPADTGTYDCTIDMGDSPCTDVWCTGVGLAPPACLVAPDSLDFGGVFVGSSTDTTFTIYNTGGGTLTGTVSETCPSDSILSPGGPYSIPGGDSLVVTLRFEPVGTGTYDCTIETGDSLCTDVWCTGVGLAPPACLVAPDSLDFGVLAVGSSKDMSFIITNTGGGYLGGSVSEACSHYSIISGGGAYNLGGGDTVVVTVRFEPTDEGTDTCTVETGDALCRDVYMTGEAGPEPLITSIIDVGNDQGRWVRIRFLKSPRDVLGSPTPITEYAIFRKIDEDLAARPESARLEEDGLNEDTSRANDQIEPLYPPGDWDFIVAIPADAEDEYASVVPTLKDSTIVAGMYYTTFFVRARTATPGVYFDSQPDSGYSVDNLAPAVPEGLSVAYLTGSGNQLEWDPSEDEDFDYFRIYRGDTHDFTTTPENFVDATTATSWTDPIYDGGNVFYKITAVDFSGNESDAASPATAISAESFVPDRFALYQNVPNPFNPTTIISYDVPVGGGWVTLRVYDVSGALVQTLVDEPQNAGRKTTTWNARDTKGRRVASGVYFYRLVAPGFEKTRKMVLLQ